jgi:membrane protein YdbS with pleckstrin-like domain
MFDWIRQKVLLVMRVPHAPEPPFGAPGSVRIFRAGINLYYLRLARWGIGQFGVLIGLIISLSTITWYKGEIERGVVAREKSHAVVPAQAPAPAAVQPAAAPASVATPSPVTKAELTTAPHKAAKAKRDPRKDFQIMASRTPGWFVPVFEIFEVWGVLVFLVQLPITYAAVRINWELHWYIVTDRSLRIRTGLMSLQEATMSFANLQQVEVKQGPLQRLLGLADVHVQSAGGGGVAQPGHHVESLHTGIFHSVNNATEIRDLILERLRQFRQAGLGDPDDQHHAPAPAAMTPGEALAAANEVLTEVRALRAALI